MTLAEALEREIAKKQWTQQEAAEQIGLHRVHLNTILAGRNRVTPLTALKLEQTFGVKAEDWLRLQAHHDLSAARRFYGFDRKKGYTTRVRKRA